MPIYVASPHMTTLAKTKITERPKFVTGLAALCLLPAANAVDMGGFAIHGSLSTTAAYSPEYNYLGDTKESLDLNQNELIVNGTRRFENGLKLAAQLYAYELAGYEDMTVDFANLDYSFRPEIGLRVGRSKLIGGLYTDVQDLDQVRTFASLPLNFYPRGSRAFASNYDGGEIYGQASLGKAGSIDYQAYVGTMPRLDNDMPFSRGIGATDFEINGVYGGGTRWNTPIEGLRLGYTYQAAPEIEFFRGPAHLETDYRANYYMIEYTRGKWVLALEHKRAVSESVVTNFPVPDTKLIEESSYAQASYQATEKLGLGTYFAYTEYSNADEVKDLAFAASYAVQSWWLVKAEVHLMNGISQLGTAGDINPGASDETWTYFMLKSTLSF